MSRLANGKATNTTPQTDNPLNKADKRIIYINEPHAGGGNPVLAIGDNTEAIFTDMLGTSLGVANGNNYSQITKTSFGSDSNNANSFFTGKPHVEDLGYAFLFRNYRADIGKWLSQDIFNYPDGYNNFAYCNNKTITFIDLYGAAGINYIPSPFISGNMQDLGAFSGGNELVSSNDGFYVIAHGCESGISSSSTEPLIDFDKVVDDIKNAQGYNDYDTIELVACYTGRGDDSFAKKLADALKKKVKAPTGVVNITSKGKITNVTGETKIYE